MKYARPSLCVALVTSVLALAACADDAAPAEDGTGGGGAVTGAGGLDGGTPTAQGSGAGDASSAVGTGDSSSTGTGDGGGSQASSGTGNGTGSGGAGQGGGESTTCPPPACDAALPDVGPIRDFEHTSSAITAATGSPQHRGRDMFYGPNDPVWVLGKFTYGVFDTDLQDEEVDVWLDRDCGGAWEKIGTARTTADGDHETVEGVEDTGGWIYFQVPPEVALGPGRHRFELVVAGDLTHTPLYVDIVPPETPIIVSDVDGTLTTSETEEFQDLLTGDIPDANPDSPEVLGALASKGYRVFYLTARPEFLVARTREFLAEHGYPPGLVHTTLGPLGATGSAAHDFKLGELQAIGARGLRPAWAFGNTETDASAYVADGIEPAEQRIMFQFEDTVSGSRTIQSYSELLPEIDAQSDVCD